MQLNWLHLTDLHHGMANQGWLLHGVRHRLRDDLEYLSERCGPWDLILFTGDLTQRGTEPEFQVVDGLLDELREDIARLQPGRPPVLLAVPGNQTSSGRRTPVRSPSCWTAGRRARRSVSASGAARTHS